MRRSDPGTREHRDRELRNHRHIERDAVAGLDAELFHHVGKAADLAVKLQIRQRSLFAGLAFPDERGLVLSPRRQVSVEAVVRDIDAAADKPLSVRLKPFEHGVPTSKPIERFRLLRPKAGHVLRRIGVGEQVFLKRTHVGRSRQIPLAGQKRGPRSGLDSIVLCSGIVSF